MLRYLPLIAKNSLRNRRRSILTISSMALSLCLMGVLMATYHAFFFSDATPEQALRLITRNRVSMAVSMPMSYLSRIKQVPGVREVSPLQWFGGVYKEPKNIFARYAVDPMKVFVIRPEYKVPSDQVEQFQRDRAGCAIGAGLARKYDLKIGDRMTLKGDIFPVTVELTVRAVYDNPDDGELLFFHLEYLHQLLPQRRRDLVTMFMMVADSPGSVPRVAKAIDEQFRNSTARTRTEPERALTLGFLSMLGNVKVFLLSICGALTFTILLVSANTMAMAVRERTREVGVLKTLGFTSQAILGMILGEAAFLSLLGGLIGCGLAIGLTAMVRALPALILQIHTLTLQPSVAAVLILTSILIGVSSALIPAWRVSRLPILVSLRGID